MSSNKTVEHTGIIETIDNDAIKVSILSQSACSSCHAKGGCSASDMQNKTVEINHWQGDFKIGEAVRVILQESLGFKALFLGYLLPFLIVLVTLITVYSITNQQGMAGLLSLGILIPYYLTLYLLRDNIKKSFSFAIKKF